MKNLRKSRKALSPVVASIILIAVTVAVSIAVAAWMGALVVGQMNTEQIKITSIEFTNPTTATVVVHNFGTSGVTISEAWINDYKITISSVTLSANGDSGPLSLAYPDGFVTGGNYQVKIATSTGNVFMQNAVA
jgi:flagellin-like protein